MARTKMRRKIPLINSICAFCGLPHGLSGVKGRSIYDWYITRSKGWKSVRYWALERADYKCQQCGLNEGYGLHVHHLNYSHLGHEFPEDVVVLCEACHKAEHQKELVSANGDSAGKE